MTASIEVSRGSETFKTSKDAAEVTLYGTSDDKYCVKVYLDKLFGTFAFQQAQCSC